MDSLTCHLRAIYSALAQLVVGVNTLIGEDLGHMNQLDQLNTEVAQVAADDTTVQTAVLDLQTVVTDLKAQISAGNPIDLSGALASLAQVHTDLQKTATADPGAQPATPPAPPAPPAPPTGTV